MVPEKSSPVDPSVRRCPVWWIKKFRLDLAYYLLGSIVDHSSRRNRTSYLLTTTIRKAPASRNRCPHAVVDFYSVPVVLGWHADQVYFILDTTGFTHGCDHRGIDAWSINNTFPCILIYYSLIL